MVLVIKNPPANAGNTRDAGSILGWKDFLVEGLASHSRIVAWRNPWTGGPDGLWSIRSQRVSDMTEVT